MTDFEYECKKRKDLARQAKHRKCGSKSKKCSLSTDYMTNRQWKERNGTVMSINMNNPVSWEDFKGMSLQTQKDYISNIIDTYNEIIADEIYDAPLMLEYNTWRAMTMLDGGTIKPNLKFDDIGKPLSTAVGNKADIECYYDNFVVSVEVENTGTCVGKETIQLYYQDVVSSVTRPVKEFCAFQQVELGPGEKRELEFELSAEDLGFFNRDNVFVTEPGEFRVYAGSNSMEVKENTFTLIK